MIDKKNGPTFQSRRSLLLNGTAFGATAIVSRSWAQPVSPMRTDIHISAGQSWRSNSFSEFAKYGIHPDNGLLAVKTDHLPNDDRGGPLPTGSGIFIPGKMVGITKYQPTDRLSIGRCAVLAQQLFRERAHLRVVPILEFAMAYPASSWVKGEGGGLGPGSKPWSNGLKMMSAITTFLPAASLPPACFRSVGWTQGGSFDPAPDAVDKEWSAMTAAYDALGLPGTESQPLQFYVAIRAEISTSTSAIGKPSFTQIYQFCRRNKNGRTWGTTPWYQWPFSGPDEPAYGNIHTGTYGTMRHGELEGYAKFVVEDEKAGAYYPLWRSRNDPITQTSPGIFKVPFDRPSGKAFASSQLGWQYDPLDGIDRAAQYGWRLKQNGQFLPAEPIIDGMNIVLKTEGTFKKGDTVDISYASYGPGGTNPGLHSGVYGNLMMAGPDSVFVAGKKLNVWAWPFTESIMV